MGRLERILSRFSPFDKSPEYKAALISGYARADDRILSLYEAVLDALLDFLDQPELGLSVENHGILCFLDIERTLFLQTALGRSIVLPSRTCIHLGAGTGILGLTALAFGIDKVILVENDKQCVSFISFFLEKTGYKKRGKTYKKDGKTVILMAEDARTIDVPDVDLVICELLETHLISEDQVSALKNISKHAKDAVFFPSKDELYLSLASKDEKDVTTSLKIGEVDFSRIADEGISFSGELIASRSAKAHYLKLWDVLTFPDGTVCDREFFMMLQRKLIHLKGWEPQLRKGDRYRAYARFRFGQDDYSGYGIESI